MRSTDYITPFIDCLNNEKVSEKAHEISLNGLNHVLAYNLAADATASTIVDILNDRVFIRIDYLTIFTHSPNHDLLLIAC